MKSRFITDPQDPFDSFIDTAGAETYASFWPLVGQASGKPPASAPLEIPLTPALTSEAVAASGAQSGPSSNVSMTAGGITINLLFDAAAMAAPASFRAGIQQAASLLTASISDQITVNIKIDYSGTGGGAAAGPDNGLYQSYSAVRADLVNNASPGDATFNPLPSGSSIQGQSNVAVWNAQLKLWGVLGANDTTTDDGSATFATDINSGLLVGVALHELTHAMGRVPYGPPYSSSPDILDLFRFTSPGVRLINGASTASAAYFSVDGGNTKLADYGQTSDPSDFLNSGAQGPNDPFNEFYTGSTLQGLTAVDKEQLDALGFHTLTPVTTVIEALGSTSLVQVGAYYYLDGISTGSGPLLRYSGAPVVAGQFGNWTPIGAEQVAGGYDVAWKNPGADQYTVWSTDSSGTLGSFLVATVSGSSTALELLETTFHQDLNGDGVIGAPPPVVIQTNGSTSLVEIGNNFYMYTSGTGPELKYSGAAVTTGEFGTWTPYGAVQVAGGYDVAWKNPGADQYTAWSADGSGNLVSFLVAAVSGSSTTLESLENTFHQDLNGDGVIGVPTTVIQTNGSTSLTEVGNTYYLYTGGSGPSLKYGGAAVTAGEFGAWTPIGAEQVAGGYDVAWKNPGADQYTVWSTDSSGTLGSFLVATVSGSSTALELLETTFHQDLNGDGVIGAPPPVVIQTNGSTSLVEIGNNFYMYTSGTGPELKYSGAAVTTGEFGTWTPYGAVQVAGGYDVAWKNPGADQYTAWSADGSGNLVSFLVAAVSGSSTTLESLENTFHQDLNGDGVIGIPAAIASPTLELAGTTSNSVTFTGSPSTLTLGTPSAFSGQIIGFAGDDTLAGSDQIDLRGFNFNTLHSSFDSTTGTLSLSSGSSTASLEFLGNYSQGFDFADDGRGGTLIVAATLSTAVASQVSNFAVHDSFVFAPNFGNVSLPNFALASDTLQFSTSIFANVTALLAATHDDGSGNAVITDAAHDTITLQHVTTAQLISHQSDFHFV